MQSNSSVKRLRELESPTEQIHTAKKMSGGDSIAELVKQISALSTVVTSMNTKISELAEKVGSVHTTLVEVKDTLNEQKNKIEVIEKKMNNLEGENRQLKLQINKIQIEINKKNLVFKGLKVNNDPEKCVVDLCKAKFNIDVKVDKIRTITRNGLIIVTFLYENHVEQILKNKKSLKNTGIYVFKDIPKALREQKKVLLKMKSAIKKKHAKVKIVCGTDWMVVNDNKYIFDGKNFFLNGLMENEEIAGLLGTSITEFIKDAVFQPARTAVTTISNNTMEY